MQKLSNSQFCKLNCEGSTPVVSRPWKSGWESSAKLKCARASLPHQYILAKHRPKVQACLKTLFWCSWPPHSAQKAVRMVLHDRACNHTPTMNKPDLELDFPSGIVRFLLHFGQIHFIPFQPYDIRGETVHDRIWSNQLRPGLLLHEALLLQLLLLLKLKLLLLLLLLLLMKSDFSVLKSPIKSSIVALSAPHFLLVKPSLGAIPAAGELIP